MRAERVTAGAFGLSAVASVGLIVLYLSGGDPPAEGILLGTALGGLGVGLVAWTVLISGGDETEERAPLESGEPRTASRPPQQTLSRRSLFVRLFAVAGGALGAGLAIPSLSLGPRPGQSLFRTAWTPGARVVDGSGSPLRPTDVEPDSVTTVFPDGAVGSADAQALLVRIDPDLLRLPSGRSEWAPDGAVAYSKICTHAGCPVGLYRADSHELLCPCHQSTFDVLSGAEPTFGPADRPLPQLPMDVDGEGYLIARDDFSSPVGPGFWDMTTGEGS